MPVKISQETQQETKYVMLLACCVTLSAYYLYFSCS